MAEDVNKNKELAAALRRILTEGTFTSRDITLAADALDPPPKDEPDPPEPPDQKHG